MKGLLIKSGEKAWARLILLLIRPDKAGTGGSEVCPSLSPSPTALLRAPAQAALSRLLGVALGGTHLPASVAHGAQEGAGLVILTPVAPQAGAVRWAQAWFSAEASPGRMSCPCCSAG